VIFYKKLNQCTVKGLCQHQNVLNPRVLLFNCSKYKAKPMNHQIIPLKLQSLHQVQNQIQNNVNHNLKCIEEQMMEFNNVKKDYNNLLKKELHNK